MRASPTPEFAPVTMKTWKQRQSSLHTVCPLAPTFPVWSGRLSSVRFGLGGMIMRNTSMAPRCYLKFQCPFEVRELMPAGFERKSYSIWGLGVGCIPKNVMYIAS